MQWQGGVSFLLCLVQGNDQVAEVREHDKVAISRYAGKQIWTSIRRNVSKLSKRCQGRRGQCAVSKCDIPWHYLWSIWEILDQVSFATAARKVAPTLSKKGVTCRALIDGKARPRIPSNGISSKTLRMQATGSSPYCFERGEVDEPLEASPISKAEMSTFMCLTCLTQFEVDWQHWSTEDWPKIHNDSNWTETFLRLQIRNVAVCNRIEGFWLHHTPDKKDLASFFQI